MGLRLGIAALVLVGCTSVVQEPADLEAEKVHELAITQGDGTSIRIAGQPGWIEGGAELFVQNRLTSDLVATESGPDGSLDVTIAGLVGDVFSVSRFAGAESPHQLTTREHVTIPAWGWGYGGTSGCAPGAFELGEVGVPVGEPRAACFAEAVPTRRGELDLFAVGTDALALQSLAAPAVRLLVRLMHATSVHVAVATEDSDGNAREFSLATELLPEQIGFFTPIAFGADHLLDPEGQPLYPGLSVTGLWIWTTGVDAGLAVDEVVLENVDSI